jgi:hypothetical protein
MSRGSLAQRIEALEAGLAARRPDSVDFSCLPLADLLWLERLFDELAEKGDPLPVEHPRLQEITAQLADGWAFA